MTHASKGKMPAFDEGVIAAGTGMSLDDNPYELGTDAHSDWQAGFLSEKDAEEATRPDGC